MKSNLKLIHNKKKYEPRTFILYMTHLPTYLSLSKRNTDNLHTIIHNDINNIKHKK